ncbi:hypothetical protein [Metallibacterium sp.]|uniref:hypothetical protein n=1 Tax=Metallibacterium sp. TaxID=2940281 RepID=UPI0026296919|nr:hypothetical protein [Metallibacterium sp.]
MQALLSCFGTPRDAFCWQLGQCLARGIQAIDAFQQQHTARGGSHRHLRIAGNRSQHGESSLDFAAFTQQPAKLQQRLLGTAWPLMPTAQQYIDCGTIAERLMRHGCPDAHAGLGIGRLRCDLEGIRGGDEITTAEQQHTEVGACTRCAGMKHKRVFIGLACAHGFTPRARHIAKIVPVLPSIGESLDQRRQQGIGLRHLARLLRTGRLQ